MAARPLRHWRLPPAGAALRPAKRTSSWAACRCRAPVGIFGRHPAAVPHEPRALLAPRGWRSSRQHSFAAASALVSGEVESEVAVNQAAEKLLEGLQGQAAKCVLWFAKGYGLRCEPIGPLLQKALGSDAVVVGSSSEGGVIGDGREVQESSTFALSALALAGSSIKAFPFHSSDFSCLPELGRGGSWQRIRKSRSPVCALTFCTVPSPAGLDPQVLVEGLDRALVDLKGGQDAPAHLPVVVGGLCVGPHVFVDGTTYQGGGFGLVLQGTAPGVHLGALVCQGAIPFGPWLEITRVANDHIITGINGQSPQEVLEPIISGPDVPGHGGHSMLGIFVDPTPVSTVAHAATAALASAALDGRPSCLVRPMHTFTQEGHLVLSPLCETLPYAEGMQLQMHCFSPDHALQELRERAQHDVSRRGGKQPDAAVMVSCGARGSALFGQEGLESAALRDVWGSEVPTVGIFAGGEIGPVGLKTYMHGYTTSCLLLRGQDKA